MATKTSAVADEPIEVLFALHPNFNITDFAGPLEVFATANYENDKCKCSAQSPDKQVWLSKPYPSAPLSNPAFVTITSHTTANH